MSSSSSRSTRSSTRKTPTASTNFSSRQSRIVESLKPSRKSKGRGKPYNKATGSDDEKFGIVTSSTVEILVIDDGVTSSRGQAQPPQPEEKKHEVKGQLWKRKVTLSKEEEEQILRDFDLDSAYGACRGISRRDRYLRALRYNLKPQPSLTVKEIIDEHDDDTNYNTCIWDQNELLRIKIPRRISSKVDNSSLKK